MCDGEADATGAAGDEDVARFDWDGDVAGTDEEEESEEEREWKEEEREKQERCVRHWRCCLCLDCCGKC